jgi:protein-disulfide isomerase
VRFEYYHFPIVDTIAGGRESRNAAQASECANEQGKFWEYHDFLFANVRGENVGSFRDPNLKAMAEKAGLDTAQFNTCYDSGKFTNTVSQDESLGRNLGVSGTPTIFVNQRQVQASYEAVKAAIDVALAQP